jgi:tartrate dehydratase alpha subunit/fumarate hydratase class I-like protein
MQMTRGSTIWNHSHGVIGIGVGGSAEKAMLMAKESLMESIDIQDIAQKPTPSKLEKLRLELMEKINNLNADDAWQHNLES